MSQTHELRSGVGIGAATAQLSGQKRNPNATGAQQFDLKALAAKGLVRNTHRNESATPLERDATTAATDPLADLEQQRAELRRLVPLVTSHLSHFKTGEDRLEALRHALMYPDFAIHFWRGKAKQLGLK